VFCTLSTFIVDAIILFYHILLKFIPYYYYS
jgi:hypothetical protein